MKKSALIPCSLFLIPSLFLSGCFDEPTPAYKTVPKEARVYLKEMGLADLRGSGEALKAGATIDYLNLDRNQLTNVDAVASLTGLKWLRINGNRLSALPDLGALVNLRRIYLKNNRFTEVPETLKDLPALTDVDLSGNPIETVPDWLAAKPNLQNLSFTGTHLSKLPENLEAWRSLHSLQLGDLKLSAEEMARIRKALPEVAVVF